MLEISTVTGLAPDARDRMPAAQTSARTFVLVHGAWHGGWCWSRVADRLRAAGHQVFTPTQTGLGERKHLLSKDITLDTFRTDIVNVIEAEELSKIVLVGHSFGGLAISGVADVMPERIRHLVYLDLLVVEGGKSPFDSLPADVVAARRKSGRGIERRLEPSQSATVGVRGVGRGRHRMGQATADAASAFPPTPASRISRGRSAIICRGPMFIAPIRPMRRFRGRATG